MKFSHRLFSVKVVHVKELKFITTLVLEFIDVVEVKETENWKWKSSKETFGEMELHI